MHVSNYTGFSRIEKTVPTGALRIILAGAGKAKWKFRFKLGHYPAAKNLRCAAAGYSSVERKATLYFTPSQDRFAESSELPTAGSR